MNKNLMLVLLNDISKCQIIGIYPVKQWNSDYSHNNNNENDNKSKATENNILINHFWHIYDNIQLTAGLSISFKERDMENEQATTQNISIKSKPSATIQSDFQDR